MIGSLILGILVLIAFASSMHMMAEFQPWNEDIIKTIGVFGTATMLKSLIKKLRTTVTKTSLNTGAKNTRRLTTICIKTSKSVKK